MDPIRRSFPRLVALVATTVTASTLATTARAAGGVRHVGVGQPYTTIQSAIDASLDGDVVLVTSGTYASATIDGKGIALVADSGASVTLTGRVLIQNVTAGRSVVVSGLVLQSSLESRLVAGSLRVSDCRIDNAYADPRAAAAYLLDSADASFLRCQLQGVQGDGWYDTPGRTGSPALYAENSRVAMDRCDMRGGDGNPGGGVPPGVNLPGGNGGDGLQARNSRVFLTACHATGGDGKHGFDGYCVFPFQIYPTSGGNGGVACRLTGATSDVSLRDTLLTPGIAGTGGVAVGSGCTSAPDGNPGLPTASSGGTIAFLPGVARTLDVDGVVRAGQPLVFTVHAQQGDVAFLALTSSSSWFESPFFQGIGLFAQPLTRVALGPVGASGTVTWTQTPSAPPVGTLARTQHAQLVVLGGGNRLFATSATTIVLDSTQ